MISRHFCGRSLWCGQWGHLTCNAIKPKLPTSRLKGFLNLPAPPYRGLYQKLTASGWSTSLIPRLGSQSLCSRALELISFLQPWSQWGPWGRGHWRDWSADGRETRWETLLTSNPRSFRDCWRTGGPRRCSFIKSTWSSSICFTSFYFMHLRAATKWNILFSGCLLHGKQEQFRGKAASGLCSRRFQLKPSPRVSNNPCPCIHWRSTSFRLAHFHCTLLVCKIPSRNCTNLVEASPSKDAGWWKIPTQLNFNLQNKAFGIIELPPRFPPRFEKAAQLSPRL